MKRIGMYVLLVALIVGIGALVWNDPMVQHMTRGGDRALADGYARAICEQDPEYLAAHSGAGLARSVEEWRGVTAQLVACSGVRYLGSLNSPRGPEYVYVLSILGKEDYFILTVGDGKVVKVQ